MLKQCFIGIDVGTGSARAGLVAVDGRMIAKATRDIKTWNTRDDYYEQSSDDIWQACVECVKDVLAQASASDGVRKEDVRGLGFDATCSLVVLDEAAAPVTISPDSLDNQRNIIVWMDHRASKEAAEINQTNHNVLNYVGGKVSLEMQMPKLLWLKRNMQEACWTRAAHFYDLPDFLTFRATGSSVRSLCSLVCKWTYMHHPAHVAANAATVGWSNSFLQQVGLDDLATDNYARLGTQVQAPGSPIANGLSAAAAAELGLLPGTPVATSLIDAHAGGVGALGARSDASTSVNLPERLALICGTSSCHMALSAEPLFVPGVWGPYYSAMVPELYLNEGGQSATGKLIDHIIKRHAAYPELASQALARQRAPTALLTETLTVMAARAGVPIATLSRNVHVLPYFHGNRSPLADPSLRGSIVGLSLSETIEDLAVLYLATVQAIAYGTRHILETMASRGHSITTLVACGGLAKSSLFVQQHADVSGCTILLPKEEESVLLGAAILGACGSRHFPSIQDAMASMSGTASTVTPDATLRSFHEAKFKVFRRMHEDFLFYRTTMEKTE